MDLVEDKVVEEVQDPASGEALPLTHMLAEVEAGCPAASIPVLPYLSEIRHFLLTELK